jgi:hypothetical protein
VVIDTFQIGRYRLGVRWSEPEFSDRLRAALPSRVRHVPAPPNFSVVVGRAPGRVRAKHQLHDAQQMRLDSVSPGRILVALVRRLDDIERWSADDSALRLRADVLVPAADSRTAVLVDQRLRRVLNHEAGKLRRAGWRVVDVPIAEVDDTAAELVLPSPVLPLEVSLADLAADGPTDPMLLDDPPSRLRVTGVVVGAAPDATDRALVNGVAMAAAPPATGINRATAERTLRLLDALPMRGVDWWSGGLAEVLAKITSG